MKVKKAISGILAASILCAPGLAVSPAETLTAAAAVSYPVQYFRFAMADTDQNVNSAGSGLVPAVQNGTNAEKWSLNWISEGVFEIVSASSGQILTSSGSGVTLAADTDGAGQRWRIEGVEKDFDGYYLYYKVTSNEDPSKALTYVDGSGFTLSSYTGGEYQKYKLNLDGCEGFAANCMTSAGEKACTIGGLLGEVVYVSTADELEKQLNSTGARTIVVTADIDMQKKGNTRIRDNKTIVGCYGSHTIYDSQFRTNDAYGAADDSPSDNIIFRNLKMTAKNSPNRILINIWSSRQIWIDHIYFESQLSYDRKGNGQDEVGKFIWINTPYESYMDAKDRLRSPDYVTISYCHLKNRYWTVAYGTQNDEITRDRTTLLYNWWDGNVRRCPQLGNGSAHIYNNYYSAYGTDSNGSATTGIIGGDGSEMLSQNNRFQGYSASQALTMGGDANKNPARDDGSYLSESVNGTPSAIRFQSKNTSKWQPSQTSYGYSLLDAYNTRGTDTKDFCTKYAGDQTAASGMKYITDSEFSSWISQKYETPFLRHADLGTAVPASFVSGSAYRFKNANSGLYMQVDGAKAENGANVQQWGTSDDTIHDIWKLIDQGDGYYALVSAVGDGGTYALDVAGKKTANGTNVDIYQYNGGANQQFMLTQNPDGSYKLRTRVSGGKSAVEIADASMGSGANVQQWEINGAGCQDWILESAADPGCRMDATVMYQFENVNSGMVMDIASGTMAEGTNVQQWGNSFFASQKWILQEFAGGGNYYYIRSAADETYVLQANSGSGNIAIVPYSAKDSSMLFKFSKDLDGSYRILTRASKDASLVEIANAAKESGANVQQWTANGNPCQNWNLLTEPIPEPVTDPPTEESTDLPTDAPTDPPTDTPTDVPDIRGDVDGNGRVELADLIQLQRYLLAQDPIPKGGAGRADVNGDSRFNIFDIILLKRILLAK